jgi:transcriptional regulator with XRE-family HTH domain
MNMSGISPSLESEVRARVTTCVYCPWRRIPSTMGVSFRTLQNWEQGKREPNQATKMLLRGALKQPRAVLDAAERKFAA